MERIDRYRLTLNEEGKWGPFWWIEPGYPFGGHFSNEIDELALNDDNDELYSERRTGS